MTTTLNMTLCGYGSLIHFFVCFMLAIFVYLRNPSKRLNSIYSLWAFNVGLWGIGTFVAFIMPETFNPIVGFRLSMMGAVFIPALYVHFSLEHLRLAKAYRFVILISYLISLLLALTSFSPWIIDSVIAYPDNLRLPNPGMLYHFFTGFFLVAILFALGLFVYYAKRSHSRASRKKLWLHFISGLIAYVGASSNILFMYGAPPLWLSWNFFLTLYVIAMAYAVINYRLWHIEYMVRQIMVFGVLGTIFLACYFGVNYLLDYLVATHRRAHEFIASFIAFLIGYFVYRPLNDYLSDQSVFQRKYYYHKLLKDASRGMSNIESLEHLLKLVIHFVTMKMQIDNAGILSKNKETGNFHLQYQRGYEKKYIDYSLDSVDPLIEYLSSEKEVLDIERIHDYMAGGYKGRSRGRNLEPVPFEEIKAKMEEIGAICCVPSFLGRELKNILILGEKKSGDSYTEADLTILYTLAQESAIAIENAGLYDEALRKTKELGNINEQLEYSKSLLMKALNETEVANKQLQDTQAQLIHEQKMATLGRLAASVGHEVNNPLTILSMNVSRAILKYRKNPDLRVGEILELFQKMEQNIARIKAVVNTLTGLLKRSEKGKFEPLSLKLILEETLPLVQFQTYLDNLTGTEVEFDIPGNIPLIRGDLERLQEVFLNLFINAYHAMAGKRNRRIQVKAHIDQTNPKQVRVEFADNGTGMSEETMKKIFNYGFTTKAPGKGSGLGLYMCKYIIELHGGDMRVDSELGSGTTFVLTLPIYEEESTGTGDLKMEASS